MTRPPVDIAGLSPQEKRALLKELLRRQARRPKNAPLSSGQERLWALDRLQPGDPTLIECGAMRVRAALDPGLIEKALNAVVARHEILRTTFHAGDDGLTQRIAPEATLPLFVRDLTHLPREEHEAELAGHMRAEAGKAFDLTRGPLLRFSLLRMGQAEHVACITIHHIICDGLSLGVLLRETLERYTSMLEGREAELPALPAQYADFARRQVEWIRSAALDEQMAYWRRKLAGRPPVLELPGDRPRPAARRYRGAAVPFRVPAELYAGIRELSRGEGATAFMALFAVFDVLLQRYTGIDDIVVGTPASGRDRVEFENAIGYFVNTLILRTDLAGGPSFRELLRRVRRTALEAYEHQDLPVERLVEELRPARDASHAPLVQVGFVVHPAWEDYVTAPGIDVETVESRTGTSRVDLTMYLRTGTEELGGSIEYDTDLFDEATIERFAGHFVNLLGAAVVDPDRSISVLPILGEDESRKLLQEWKGVPVTPPRDPQTRELFAAEETKAYLLDRALCPVPVGVAGELYFDARASDGDAECVTVRCGVDDERRLRRTGELGRWRPGGAIELLGRADEQLFVGGHRIRPAQIEVAVGEHPGVTGAAAGAWRDEPGEPEQLVAWYTTSEGAWVAPDDLRRTLRERLPLYRVPSVLVPVESLPRGQNGAVDVAALPAPGSGGTISEVAAPPHRAADEETDRLRERSNLTKNQLLMWLGQKMQPATPLYNVPVLVHIAGPVHDEHFKRAFRCLVEGTDVLRAVIVERDGVPHQEFRERIDYEPKLYDLSDEADPESALRRWADERRAHPVDLTHRVFESALIKLGREKFVWFLLQHHIVTDGWSTTNLIRCLSELYGRSMRGTLDGPFELPGYAEFEAREREDWRSPEYESARVYWRDKLAEEIPSIPFFGDGTRRGTTEVHRVGHTLSRDKKESLRTLATGEGFCAATANRSLFNVFGAALFALLHGMGGGKRLSMGTPLANRGNKRFRKTAGLFMQVLPLRVEIDEDETFRTLAGKVGRELEQVIENQHYVMTNPPQRRHYDVTFNLHHFSAPDFGEHPARPEWVHPGHEDDALGLQVHDYDDSGDLVLDFDFRLDAFDVQQSERTVARYLRVLDTMLEHPDRALGEIELLSYDESRHLLVELNESGTRVPAGETVVDLFEEQARRNPERVALVAADGADLLTYAALEERSNKLAHRLRALGVESGTAVGLFIDRTQEMPIGLLGILKAGGAYVPVDPAYPDERLASMLERSAISLILTRSGLVDRLPEHRARVLCLDDERDGIEDEDGAPVARSVRGDDVAYVIFTSGSTGRPNGVQVTHRGLAHYATVAGELFELRPGDRALQFASISFDTAAEEIFPTLTRGATLVLRDDEMIASVDGFLERCARLEIGVLNLPTSYWHAIAADLPPGGLPDRMRLVIVGGDRMLPGRLRDWRRGVGSGVRLLNGYGPTETTVVATFADLTRATAEDEHGVTIGRPIANVKVYVLDDRQRLVPQGIPGELCIAGAGLARGYLNDPELTAERFVPDPFSDEPGARMYKSGDRCRWRADGRLEFLGRIDNQLKLRGFRVEPGEIESALQRIPAVRDAVVTAREDAGGHKRLVCYLAAREGQRPTASGLREALSETLPAYMVPAEYVLLDTLPRLPSGKIDPTALPAVTVRGRGSFVAPDSEVERELARIWSDVLGIERVGIHDNFFELGADSILAIQITSKAQRAGLALEPHQLFQHQTIAELAVVTSPEHAAAGEGPIPLPRDTEGLPTRLPLSLGQTRLWFLEQLAPGHAVFNIPLAVRLTGSSDTPPLDAGALERGLAELVRRHETLRTTIAVENGAPVQVIAPQAEFRLTVTELSDLPAERREEEIRGRADAEAARPFDLRCGPLIRAELLNLAPDDRVLLLSMHHIVSDAWSVEVLLRELGALYEAFRAGRDPALPALPLQYADFAQWQRERLGGETRERLMAYWRERLDGTPTLDLPADRPRPRVQSHRGATLTFRLPSTLTRRLKLMAQDEGVTPFMLVLAAFQTLLGRRAGQDDVVVGSPVAGRNRPEIAGLIGFFVNMIVLRSDLSGDPTFRELLGRVRDVCLGAYAHQELPFEQLVDELQTKRDLSREPLFQVCFTLQSSPIHGFDLPGGLRLTPIEPGTSTAKYDLGLLITEDDEGFLGGFEYATDLFDASTVENLAQQLCTLLDEIARNPERRLSDLLPGDGAAVVTTDQQREESSAVHLPHASPETETEIELVRIWSELLRVRKIGVHDNFFELGGDSILSIQVVSAANRAGLSLTPRHLFEFQTVAELARALDGGAQIGALPADTPAEPMPVDRERVVELTSGPTQRPLFCIHPGGGEVSVYRFLIEGLSLDRAAFGIRSRAAAGSGAEHPSIEEMAVEYADLIRARQSTGPYSLLGWSMGGVTALAVAAELESRGEEVAFLGLLDAHLPQSGAVLEPAEVLRHLARDIQGHLGARELPDVLSEALRLAPAMLDAWFRLSSPERAAAIVLWLRSQGLADPRITAESLAERLTLLEKHVLLLATARPRKIRAPMHLWLTQEGEESATYDRGLGRFTTGEVREETVDGDHFTMLYPPHVGSLATGIGEALKTKKGTD